MSGESVNYEERWATQAALVVYEDDNVQVLFKPGRSDFLLVTFGDAITLANGTDFYAAPVASRFGIACLGFVAKAPNWFPAGSIAKALPSVEYTLGSFSRIVTYGCSMGGYAALKYSRALKATHVLAFCPQWSIDPAECGSQDSGFAAFFDISMRRMGLRSDDVSGIVHIFYDPDYSIDSYHFDVIAKLLPGAKGWHVHNADHHVTPILAGSAVAASLIASCLTSDDTHMYAVINSARRRSVIRARILLKKAAARHPQLVLRAISKLKATADTAFLTVADHFAPLIEALLSKRLKSHAAGALSLVGPDISETRRALLRAGLEGRKLEAHAAAAISTTHNTELQYDLLYGRLCHGSNDWTSLTSVGLRPLAVHRMAFGWALGLVEGDFLLTCATQPGGTVDLEPAASCDGSTCFLVLGNRSTKLRIKWRDYYVCAEPGGSAYFDRLSPNAWEAFSISAT